MLWTELVQVGWFVRSLWIENEAKLSPWKPNFWARAKLDKRYVAILRALYPPNAWVEHGEYDSHDFLLYVLQHPARFNKKVQPICLPHPDAEFGGQKAIAAGWGRFSHDQSSQSQVLRVVTLTVSRKVYKHRKLFGTILSKKNDLYQDPCPGDSGWSEFKIFYFTHLCFPSFIIFDNLSDPLVGSTKL